jgi:hypothetical protein
VTLRTHKKSCEKLLMQRVNKEGSMAGAVREFKIDLRAYKTGERD